MSTDDLDARLTAVFRTVFKNPNLSVSDSTTAADVDGWDSLNHIVLVSEIEGAFGIKFKLRDLMSIENVGDLRRLIAIKTSRA